MKIEEIKNGTVASPTGFLASGMHAGIKANKRKLDCSLIVSEVGAVSAGVFTVNKVKAWPLLYNESVIDLSRHRAILANSGNANCFNGESGRKTVQISLSWLASRLRIKRKEIFLASTGIIGKAFPVEKLEAAIPVLVKSLSREGGTDAARGILTTDTHPKQMAVRFRIGGKRVLLAGMAKGSGMIYPHMTLSGKRHATMLCFLTTDLSISKEMLKAALAEATERTFNNIAVDNDMSTNDMALILANGLARNPRVATRGKSFDIFVEALTHVCGFLARELVKDGEGVRHICEIKITGARTGEEAKCVGRQISTSMLFKTMLAGEDPNWGRVVAAIGSSGVDFSEKLDIAFDSIFILKNGRPLPANREKVRKVLRKGEFVLKVDLKKGKCSDTFLTTDLTKFYVWINSTYSS